MQIDSLLLLDSLDIYFFARNVYEECDVKYFCVLNDCVFITHQNDDL